MPTFKDTTGREWMLRIDVLSIGDVREQTGVYLGVIDEFPALARDVVKLCDVLWSLIRTQANETGINKSQFLLSMTKDAIPQSFDALTEAYLFFCPTAEEAELRMVMAEDRRGSPSPTLSPSPGNSVESAASIPTHAA